LSGLCHRNGNEVVAFCDTGEVVVARGIGCRALDQGVVDRIKVARTVRVFPELNRRAGDCAGALRSISFTVVVPGITELAVDPQQTTDARLGVEAKVDGQVRIFVCLVDHTGLGLNVGLRVSVWVLVRIGLTGWFAVVSDGNRTRERQESGRRIAIVGVVDIRVRRADACG